MSWVTNLFTLFLLLAQVNGDYIVLTSDILRNKTIRVEPYTGTCGSQGPQAVLNGSVPCTSCRKHPVLHQPQVIIKGERSCGPANICNETFVASRGTWGETYMFRMKYSFSGATGQLLQIGNLDLKVYEDALHVNERRLSPLEVNTWYDIAIQISGTTLAVFLDSREIFRDTMPLFNGSKPVRIGSPNPETRLCEPLTLPICQGIGFGAFVKPTTVINQKSLPNYLNATGFLDLIDQCHLGRDMSTLFGCSYLFDVCDGRSNARVHLCPEFCASFVAECGRYAPVEFPMNMNMCNRTQPPGELCLNATYKPDTAAFLGSIANFTYYPEVLTNREIEFFSGRLDSLSPEVCVCPEDYPVFYTPRKTCGNNPQQTIAILRDAIEYAVDYNPHATAWISNPTLESVSLVVDLGRETLINKVTIQLANYSLIPDRVQIEVRTAGNDNWKEYCNIALSCSDTMMYSNGEPIPWFANWIPSGHVPCYQAVPNRTELSTGDIFSQMKNWKYIENSNSTLKWFDESTRQQMIARQVRFTFRTSSNVESSFAAVSDVKASGLSLPDFCNCHPVGVLDQNNPCPDDNLCVCLTSTEVSKDCAPVIDSIDPSFGPVSGGTLITMKGRFLHRPEWPTPELFLTVEVEQRPVTIEFLVIQNSSDKIIAVSNRVNTSIYNVTHRTGVFNLTWKNEYRTTIASVFPDTTFTYRPDTVIERITPRSSFVLGGISQTITGMYIDSVARPLMTVIYMADDKNYVQDRQACDVINSTTMTCPSPHIYNVGLNDLPTKRRRRQSGACTGTSSLLNCQERKFYLSFYLDGIDTYRNASEVLGDGGTILIWKNPNLKTFEDSYGSEVQVFRTYQDQKYLNIEGEGLCRTTGNGPHPNTGCDLKDYMILVGTSPAEVNDVLTNNVRFTPPGTEPVAQYGKDGNPDVTLELGNLKLHIGYIRYEDSWWDDPAHLYGVIGGICGAVVVIILIVVAVCCWRARQKYSHIDSQLRHRHVLDDPSYPYRDHRYSRRPFQPGADLFAALEDDLKANVQSTLIDSNLITIGKQIGKGQFGEVYSGRYEDGPEMYPVALKTVKQGSAFSDMAEFLMEGTLMKDCSHENVLGLIGTFIMDGRPYVVLPLMENGDLKTFISNPNNNFTVLELVEFGYQVARGMEYLSSQKIVHRDMAARNCMINKEMLVKVADFGLARDICEKEYYSAQNKHRPMPIKWMALETLEDFKATTASDVWSFGVTLWELLTRGMKPYPDVDALDLKRYLKSGRRLEKPASAPGIVYELMMDCWTYEPEKRPTFEDIALRLESMIIPAAPALPPNRQDYVKRNAIANNPYSAMRFRNDGTDRAEAMRGRVDVDNDYLDILRQSAHLNAGVDDGYLKPPPSIQAEHGYTSALPDYTNGFSKI